MITANQQIILESGLARLRGHLESGRSLGIISAAKAATSDQDITEYRETVKRIGDYGYGRIQASGRSQWGAERSLLALNMTTEHLRTIGNEFHHEAAIHVQGKRATIYNLDAHPQKPGTREELWPTHDNNPNNFAVTILKGVGFKASDKRNLNRSFTQLDTPKTKRRFDAVIRTANTAREEYIDRDGCYIQEGYVLESLLLPRGGQLHPCWHYYAIGETPAVEDGEYDPNF